MRRAVVAIAVVIGVLAVAVSVMAYQDGRITCADFASHAAAQRYFVANPDSGLDRDSDGNPCERLR